MAACKVLARLATETVPINIFVSIAPNLLGTAGLWEHPCGTRCKGARFAETLAVRKIECANRAPLLSSVPKLVIPAPAARIKGRHS
jgi:hypothetical protein